MDWAGISSLMVALVVISLTYHKYSFDLRDRREHKGEELRYVRRHGHESSMAVLAEGIQYGVDGNYDCDAIHSHPIHRQINVQISRYFCRTEGEGNLWRHGSPNFGSVNLPP